MKIPTRLLLSLLATGHILLFTTPALAARTYLVELAVFTNQDSSGNESWANVQQPLSEKKMSRATQPGQGTLKITEKVKEIEESRFPYYVKRISNNSQRKLLLSTRWVQVVSGPAMTTIARITDARNTETKTTVNKAILNDQSTRIIPELPQLDGFINFYLNSQYTLEADIRYTPPYRPSILDEEPDLGSVSYRIHEKRRIKSGELNYYDHPGFGMVLLVTPVKTTVEE